MVDVDAVSEYARTLPNVAYTDHLLFSCSTDSTAAIPALSLSGASCVTTAVITLGVGSPLARDALQRATLDEDWEVRVYAAEALRRLGSGAAP